MIVRTRPGSAEEILAAMKSIAIAHGDGEVTDADRRTIDSAAQIVFGIEGFDSDQLEPRNPRDLADQIGDREAEAHQAMRMLAVMSLVDGRIDAEKERLVRGFGEALAVEEPYLEILDRAARGEIAAAAACIVRKNAASFPELEENGIDEDAIAPFLPYRDDPKPELEQRYLALEDLADGTFGRAFFDHFRRNGFAFPGNPAGLAEGFTTPHDSSHVLSGYSTSQQGELCVSTFIGAMHPDHPMAAEILPVIFSWHLGIKLNEIAGSSTGAFEPRKFWTSWERGAAMNTDIVDAEWDFWAATELDLEDLRSRYGLPAVASELLA